MNCSIVIVDDHQLFADALSELLEKSPGVRVLYSVRSGQQLKDRFKSSRNIPDIVLLDINLPGMNGFEIGEWLDNQHPDARIIALSMNDKEQDIIRMLRIGAKGYLLKDSSPSELSRAISEVMEKGFYHSEFVSNHIINMLRNPELGTSKNTFALSERELEFLPLACSELTYQQIADKMCVAARTVDGYREALFAKFNVKSRVGLVMFAIRQGLVEL